MHTIYTDRVYKHSSLAIVASTLFATAYPLVVQLLMLWFVQVVEVWPRAVCEGETAPRW